MSLRGSHPPCRMHTIRASLKDWSFLLFFLLLSLSFSLCVFLLSCPLSSSLFLPCGYLWIYNR